MSVEAMGGWSNPRCASRGFVRSALILFGCILSLAVPMVVLSVAMQQTGTGGPWGVAAAAAICLFAGLGADAASSLVHRAGSPLGALLAGMALRLLPPLVVCLILAVQGGGREHLAFVVYLLTFYLVTLTLDTWLAVQRIACTSSSVDKSST